jgi:hypothetical protein
MPRREDDDVAERIVAVTGRTLLLAGGFVLAALATLAVFLTDNAQYLRVAVVAVAWAFVLAMFAAGRRGSDRAAAAAREAELRRAYELELEREVAARREYELGLENEVRRETEDAMRYELDALRGDIAGLAGLRDEVARVSELRGDLAALSSLREDVARVAALRDDVAALTSLRHDLGQLAELRSEMGRLRAELTEQLSSEMLVERIVMRTQASRLPAEPTRLDGGRWTDEVPPRELTGGWPAVRLDEPRQTQQFEQVRPERASLRPPAPTPEPAESWRAPSWETPAWENPAGETPAAASRPGDAPLPSWEDPYVRPAAPPLPPPACPPPSSGDDWWARPAQEATAPDRSAAEPAFRHSDDVVAGPPATTVSPIVPSSIARPPVVEPAPSPLDWLAAHSLVDDPIPRTTLPEVPPRRRSTDEQPSADARTTQRPAVPPPVRIDDRGGYRVVVPAAEPAGHPEPPAEGNRLAEILAENGVTPATGGRRRRRYRDEDQSDDVLARVLGRN